VLAVAIPSIAPYSGDGIVGWFGVLGVLHSGKFMQVPLRFGRQFVHGWPAFTHAQFIHLPLPLHRQHEDGMETDTKLQVAPFAVCTAVCEHIGWSKCSQKMVFSNYYTTRMNAQQYL